MHPVLATISLGDVSVTLSSYKTFYLLAWILSPLLGTLVASRYGLSWRRTMLVFGVALLAGIVGARALDAAVNWSYYRADLSRIWEPHFRGFALYGGLMAAVAAGSALSRALRVPLWRLADSATPAIALGLVLMRTGCFLNGCCFGRPTSLPWGVTYPPGSRAWTEVWASQTLSNGLHFFGGDGVVRPVHPTQLYEILAALMFGSLATWMLARRRASHTTIAEPGWPFLTFAFGYTLFRLANHFLRAPVPGSALPGWFYPALYLILATGLAGVVMWRIFTRRPGSGTTRPARTAQVSP